MILRAYLFLLLYYLLVGSGVKYILKKYWNSDFEETEWSRREVILHSNIISTISILPLKKRIAFYVASAFYKICYVKQFSSKFNFFKLHFQKYEFVQKTFVVQ